MAHAAPSRVEGRRNDTYFGSGNYGRRMVWSLPFPSLRSSRRSESTTRVTRLVCSKVSCDGSGHPMSGTISSPMSGTMVPLMMLPLVPLMVFPIVTRIVLREFRRNVLTSTSLVVIVQKKVL